jgi:hypothetical protein
VRERGDGVGCEDKGSGSVVKYIEEINVWKVSQRKMVWRWDFFVLKTR